MPHIQKATSWGVWLTGPTKGKIERGGVDDNNIIAIIEISKFTAPVLRVCSLSKLPKTNRLSLSSTILAHLRKQEGLDGVAWLSEVVVEEVEISVADEEAHSSV